MDFILAEIELTGTESFSFYLSLAKYITLKSEIVAQLPIFSQHLSKKILAMVSNIYNWRFTASLCLFKFFKVTQKRGYFQKTGEFGIWDFGFLDLLFPPPHLPFPSN